MAGEPIAARISRAVHIGAVAVVATWHFGYHGSKLLTYWDLYEHRGLVLACWVAMGLVCVRGMAALLTEPPSSVRDRSLAVACLVLGTVATASGPPSEAIGDSSWAWSSASWIGVLVLLRQPLRELAVLLATNIVLTAAFLTFDRPTLSRFVIAASVTVGVQVIVAVADRRMQRAAQQATETAEAEVETLARRQAADSVHERRQQRYEYLRVQVEPLLSGLADGSLDPASPEVRHRCAVEAGRLRRLFAETDNVPDPLLHELIACADIAERRNVVVEVCTLGKLPALPTSVRRDLTEVPLAVLATAGSAARVTVEASADEVVISVIADAPHDVPLTRPRSPALSMVSYREGDDLWVETRWKAPSPSASSTTTR